MQSEFEIDDRRSAHWCTPLKGFNFLFVFSSLLCIMVDTAVVVVTNHHFVPPSVALCDVIIANSLQVFNFHSVSLTFRWHPVGDTKHMSLLFSISACRGQAKNLIPYLLSSRFSSLPLLCSGLLAVLDPWPTPRQRRGVFPGRLIACPRVPPMEGLSRSLVSPSSPSESYIRQMSVVSWVLRVVFGRFKVKLV